MVFGGHGAGHSIFKAQLMSGESNTAPQQANPFGRYRRMYILPLREADGWILLWLSSPSFSWSNGSERLWPATVGAVPGEVLLLKAIFHNYREPRHHPPAPSTTACRWHDSTDVRTDHNHPVAGLAIPHTHVICSIGL